MNWLKIAALIVISIFTVAVGLIYIAGMQAQRTLLHPNFYEGLIAETGLGSVAHQILREQMREDMVGDEEGEGFEIILDSMAGAFPPEWIEEQAVVALQDFVPYIAGDREAVTATIDLEPRRDRLEEELVTRLEELPEEEMEEAPFSPETLEEDVAELVREMDLPEKLHLAELAEDLPPDAEGAFEMVRTARGLFRFVPYLILAALFTGHYLLVGPAGGLKWFGASTAIAGLVFLLGLFIFRAGMLPAAARNIAADGDAPLDPEVVRRATEYILAQMYPFPIYYAAVGVLLLVGGVLFDRYRSKDAAEEEEEREELGGH